MKKYHILETIVVILLVIFAFSLAGCVDEWSSDYIYSEISVSEDGLVISIKSPDETVVDYHHLGTVSGAMLHGYKYLYRNDVTFQDGRSGMVYSPLEERGVLYVEVGYDVSIYAREDATDGIQTVNQFLSGEVTRYAFATLYNGTESVLAESEVEKFFSEPDSGMHVKLDVTTLRNALVYDVLAYDFYRVLAVQSGAIFQIGEEYYFVDYDKLDNSAFDADGNLSYRRGEIEAEHLTLEKAEILEKIEGRKKYIENDYLPEEGLYIGPSEEEEVVIDPREELPAVLVLVFFVGILLPLVPLVLVVVLPLTSGRRVVIGGEKKKIVPSPALIVGAVGSLLWLIGGIVIFCLLLAI